LTFGEHARALREARGIGLRELARTLEKSPTLISRVESGHEPNVSEETLVAWATALGDDPDLFLARAGKLSEAMVKVITDNPEVYIQIIRQLQTLPRKQQAAFVRQVKDGDW